MIWVILQAPGILVVQILINMAAGLYVGLLEAKEKIICLRANNDDDDET